MRRAPGARETEYAYSVSSRGRSGEGHGATGTRGVEAMSGGAFRLGDATLGASDGAGRGEVRRMGILRTSPVTARERCDEPQRRRLAAGG